MNTILKVSGEKKFLILPFQFFEYRILKIKIKKEKSPSKKFKKKVARRGKGSDTRKILKHEITVFSYLSRPLPKVIYPRKTRNPLRIQTAPFPNP